MRDYLHITELFSYNGLQIYTKGSCLEHSYCPADMPTSQHAWSYMFTHFISMSRNTFSYDTELGG